MSLLNVVTLTAVRSGIVALNGVNWANISDTDAFLASASTTTEVVDGNTVDVLLRITWTGSPLSVVAFVDGANSGALTSGDTITIPAGGASSSGVSFTLTANSSQSGTVTIVNQSDGDAPVDTFTYTLTIA